MKIAFFDTKPYDKTEFEALSKQFNYEIKYFDSHLNSDTTGLASGFDAVCVFVNDKIDKETINKLAGMGIRLIALRCSGYNNVDLKAAQGRLTVVRVPAYSPTAVAEHTAALLLCLNRKIHRAYSRTRDNNFNINGLMGIDLRGKTVGIIGTGKIGILFLEICKGFGMNTIAYDPFPQKNSDIKYVTLNDLYKQSDVISLHCPLTHQNHHIISNDAIALMKQGVIIINTSRGGLIDTDALINGIKSMKIGSAGLDVYEEEEEYFFEDKSNELIKDDDLERLLSFPNVLLTSHQGFFTQEAMRAIAETTLKNIHDFEKGDKLENEVNNS